MHVGLLRSLEDVRRDGTPIERVSQLAAQEAVGRIARRARIEPVHQIAHHRGILVDNVREDGEILIVDDRLDLVAHRLEDRLDRMADPFDVLLVANDMPFEIDEELPFLRMLRESLLERHTQEIVTQVHRLV